VPLLQSPAFGGNPLLDVTDLEAPVGPLGVVNASASFSGVRGPVLEVVLTPAAVAAMNLDNEMQFRLMLVRAAGGVPFTNGDNAYVRLCAVCACPPLHAVTLSLARCASQAQRARHVRRSVLRQKVSAHDSLHGV
jgi:hypothetical protein